MKRLLRIAGWIAGIVVVVIVLAAIALWMFFPVEKAKQMVIEREAHSLDGQLPSRTPLSLSGRTWGQTRGSSNQ